jgi:mRNA interferase MazF
MTCERGDVVVVRFPFRAKEEGKGRPALVVSNKTFNEFGHTILSMITTRAHRPWPGDILIRNHEAAGLKTPCIVRLKMFTLENNLIVRQIGRLSARDREKLVASSRLYLIADYLQDVDLVYGAEEEHA